MNRSRSLALAACLVTLAAPAFAQTTNQGPANVFQSMFGLYDTNNDAFTNSFTFDFRTGLSIASTGQSGLQQEFEPTLWKHVAGDGGDNGNFLLGFGLNADMLGQSGGQGLDGAGVHSYVMYAKYNLGAYFGGGWYKNVDLQQQFIELPFGIEAKLTRHAGVYATYNLQVNTDRAKSPQSIAGRFVTGANWSF